MCLAVLLVFAAFSNAVHGCHVDDDVLSICSCLSLSMYFS